MPRRYSIEEKRRALEALQANGGNVRKTSGEIGIPMKTLRLWKQKRDVGDEVEESIQRLRQQLIENALKLAKELKHANGSATFDQRATALNQIVDKIIRLGAKLSEDRPIEKVIRFEYENPEDNPLYQPPPGADEDHEV